jgi:hypothetical protein
LLVFDQKDTRQLDKTFPAAARISVGIETDKIYIPQESDGFLTLWPLKAAALQHLPTAGKNNYDSEKC